MVDLPAVNTPQFDWALNKMGRKAKPVAPIFQPEVPARAILFAATHHRREIWLGFPTVKAILANRIAPGLIDRYLAKTGYSGQLSDQRLPADAPANLSSPFPATTARMAASTPSSRTGSWEMFTDRHRDRFRRRRPLAIGLLRPAPPGQAPRPSDAGTIGLRTLRAAVRVSGRDQHEQVGREENRFCACRDPELLTVRAPSSVQIDDERLRDRSVPDAPPAQALRAGAILQRRAGLAAVATTACSGPTCRTAACSPGMRTGMSRRRSTRPFHERQCGDR